MDIQSFQIATPTPVQTTPVQGTSIAQMVNAANGIQQYQQSQQLNPLQIKQAQLAIEQAQQINPLAVEKAQAELETAKTGSQQAKQNYLVSGEDYSRKMINALPPIDDYVDKTGEVNQKALSRSLDIIRKSAYAVGLPNHPSNLLGQLEDAVATKDYNKYEELRNTVAKSSGTTSEQYASKFPNVQMLNTGQKAVPITMGNPSLAMQAPGTAVGNGIQLQLPPSTPTVSPTGQPGYLGAQNNQGYQFVPGGLTPGSAAAITAPVDFFQKDWPEVQAEAKGAQTKIGILQNINGLADKAFTGVSGARKSLAAGIANAVGIPLYEAEKTATDELAKNSAVLQMAGGNTDAARSIAEAMVPGGKINREAIRGVVNQLVGVEIYKQRKQEVLSRYANDPTQYANISQQVNRIDPKIFQEMTPEQVKALKKNMPKAQQVDINNQINLARSLGMFK